MRVAKSAGRDARGEVCASRRGGACTTGGGRACATGMRTAGAGAGRSWQRSEVTRVVADSTSAKSCRQQWAPRGEVTRAASGGEVTQAAGSSGGTCDDGAGT